LLVYPAPEPSGPPLPEGAGEAALARLHPLGDDVHHLRAYRRGDPPRTIAWKPTARLGSLLVREYEQPLSADIVLDWFRITGLDMEARIRRLARWVDEAERDGRRYRLVVPGHPPIGPAQGCGAPARLPARARAAARCDGRPMNAAVATNAPRPAHARRRAARRGRVRGAAVAAGAEHAGVGHRRRRARDAFLSQRPPLPGWLRMVPVLALGAFVFSTMGVNFGRDTGCAMLAAMLAVKPLETNTLRDARSLLGFALFAPFATFLLDQGPLSLALGLHGGGAGARGDAAPVRRGIGRCSAPAHVVATPGVGRLDAAARLAARLGGVLVVPAPGVAVCGACPIART
jgi:hypothetical protein